VKEMETEFTLKDLVAAAKLQQDLEKSIEERESELKVIKERLNYQRYEIVPGMMQELGIHSFVLDNGYKVSIKDEYYAKIPEEYQYDCFNWLRNNNLDGIIKTAVNMNFGKGEDQQAKELVDWMSRNGLTPNVKETVHPQTLRAFVKERMSAGLELPVDFFGASVVKATVISK
jgi:hypothetical protein